MGQPRETFRLFVPGLLLAAALLLISCGGEASAPALPTKARPTPLPTPVAVPTPDCGGAFFEQTKRTVCQPFLAFWNENGGVAIFGYPISDQIREALGENGESYTAQYFERARFELHPSTGDQVVLGRLGALVQSPHPPASPLPQAQFFPETGHNLQGVFLKFWQEKGGLALFGYPITEEIKEKGSSGQREYTVQYFERARLEFHPENAGTPFEVQLGQLGKQVYRTRYSR